MKIQREGGPAPTDGGADSRDSPCLAKSEEMLAKEQREKEKLQQHVRIHCFIALLIFVVVVEYGEMVMGAAWV